MIHIKLEKSSMKTIGVILLICSIVIYLLQILFFHDIHETLFLIFQDLAFVPIEVVLVTLILEKYLKRKEAQDKFKKMQVVISAFFADMGNPIIKCFSSFHINYDDFIREFPFLQDLNVKEDSISFNALNHFSYDIDSGAGDLAQLKHFLITKKAYILRLFDNPNLIEHDNFTDMLWSIYHILDELEHRDSTHELPENDMSHLSGDIKRAYQLVIKEWAAYMLHLKKEYPYLFSLAIRKNPFSDNDIIFK